MSEWKMYKLGKLITLNYGKSLIAEKRIKGNIPVYSSAGFSGWHNASLVESNGIIVGRKGNVGSVFYSKDPFFCIDTAYYILPDKNYDLKFIYYKLLSMNLIRLTSDSAVPGLNRETAYAQEITIPSLPTQTQIAQILTSFDDKIELLGQMNQTLETMAQTIFKEWFVDFNFPGFDGEMVDGLPKGWRKGKLGELTDIKTGKGLKRSEFKFEGEYPVIGANGELGRTDRYLLDDKFILTGRVGTLGSINISYGKKWYSDNVLIMKPYNSFYYTYFILKLVDMQSLNRGSTQPLITQTDMKNYISLIPSQNILNLFESRIFNLFEGIFSNDEQIRTLTHLRDTLLPKLMGGAVRLEGYSSVFSGDDLDTVAISDKLSNESTQSTENLRDTLLPNELSYNESTPSPENCAIRYCRMS